MVSKKRGTVHCIEHTDRVVKAAQYICKKEKGDYFFSSLAALLHDIARSMEDKGLCIDHAEKGSELALDILKKHKISSEISDQITYCIRNHRSNSRGSTLESKILKDADKLDALGAICISRVIASSLQSNQYYRPIFDSKIPFEKGSETRSAIHYIILIIEKYNNGNYFFTKTAHKLAKNRILLMENFVSQFKKEWFCKFK